MLKVKIQSFCFSERSVIMSNVNDLDLPVIDSGGEIWEAFFCPSEFAAMRELVEELQKPKLRMGGIYPLSLGERFIFALKVVADSEDVSFLTFC